MYSVHTGKRIIGLALTTAMAGALLSGCAARTGSLTDSFASVAPEALPETGQDRAVRQAEAAVASDPRNPAHRVILGKAYLDAGRFASAETSFNDAMTLGDTSPRTALSLALALTAQAKYSQAAALLNDWEGEIATADLGLALSLAGQPERGIHLMSNAIRNGENTVKMRQNLAYAYAVAGRWREARLMAAQDVPAGEVGARMEYWAQLSHPAAYQHRIAGLLGVPAGVQDTGQPVRLALGSDPALEQLAAQASASAANAQLAQAPIERVEVPASSNIPGDSGAAIEPDDDQAPAMQRASGFTQAYVSQIPSAGAKTPRPSEPITFKPEPQPQPVTRAAAQTAAAPVQRAGSSAPSASSAKATHLVQLGSFASEQRARQAWSIYLSRYPELTERDMVITEAVVRGKRYWRVSAGGYSRAESRSMCERIASRGEGCIAWAASSPLPGAVKRGVDLARR